MARQGCSAERNGQEAAEGKGHRLKDLLEFLARALVDDPGRVEVTEYEEDDETLVLELDVAEEDRGKVIGRHGRTVKALRAVMKAGGARDGRRVFVEVVD